MSFGQTPEIKSMHRLDQITTVWSVLNDPSQFILRYAPAIQRYFRAIIRSRHEAEEAIQDFIVKVMQHGFMGAQADRGRFRDYLKASVRNAAMAHLRRTVAGLPTTASMPLEAVAGPDAPDMDQAWIEEWRRCVLERAWRGLENDHRPGTGENLGAMVLRIVVDHPDEDSTALAARAFQLTGERLSAEAFRQRLSRARKTFARLLVHGVAETLQSPTPADVEDELIDLGLIAYVRDFLPANWRTSGFLPHAS
jgi:hypothetical protein